MLALVLVAGTVLHPRPRLRKRFVGVGVATIIALFAGLCLLTVALKLSFFSLFFFGLFCAFSFAIAVLDGCHNALVRVLLGDRMEGFLHASSRGP